MVFTKTYVVGSSKNMTGGLLTNSRDIDSLFLSPPESLSVGVSFTLVNLNISRTSAICKIKLIIMTHYNIHLWDTLYFCRIVQFYNPMIEQ